MHTILWLLASLLECGHWPLHLLVSLTLIVQLLFELLDVAECLP